MPLIKCPDCGKLHSDQAVSCPQCGRPNKPIPQISQEIPAKIEGGFLEKNSGCLAPLVVLLLFVLVPAVIGTIVNQSQEAERIKKCNEGKTVECEALINDTSFSSYKEITNKQYAKRFVEREERRVKEVAEREEREAEEGQKAMQLILCEEALKDSLKDPESLKVLTKDRENILIEYTATNGFGGRVRDVLDCKTGKNLQ